MLLTTLNPAPIPPITYDANDINKNQNLSGHHTKYDMPHDCTIYNDVPTITSVSLFKYTMSLSISRLLAIYETAFDL